MKKLVILIVLVIVIGAVWLVWEGYKVSAPSSEATSPLNATYIIDGNEVTLVDGKSEIEAAPGSATKIETSIFGEPVYGDMNKDGQEDAVMFIVQNPGGSGTFYYVAAALSESGTYTGTNAVHLGDRIAPQNVEIRDGVLIANYAERKPGEPMSEQPSVGVSRYLMIEKGELVEIKQVME